MAHPDPVQRAILMDLDGTLVDTAPDIVAAANRMLNQLGRPSLPFETVRGFIGKGVANLVAQVLDVSGIANTIAHPYAEDLFYQHYRETNGQFGTVFPGVHEGLAVLKETGYRLACVTNKPIAFAETLLQLTGLDKYFEFVLGGDSIPHMKPSPEPLFHACRLLKANPEHTLMVGDSAVDVAAARAAGMPVVIVRYGYPGEGGLGALICDAFVDSLQQLALNQTTTLLTVKKFNF